MKRGLGALLLAALALVACGDISAEPITRGCETDVDLDIQQTGELERAATFVIRAGASAGFVDEGPTFRDYSGIEESDRGFTASFRPDLTVEVVLDGGTWRVSEAEGKIDEEACLTLLGYSEMDSHESVGHEFLNLRLSPADKRRAEPAKLYGAPLWHGPIPYEGYSSRCYAQLYDEDGNATHRTKLYPIAIPRRETDRNSGVTYIRVPDHKESAAGEFVCRTVKT